MFKKNKKLKFNQKLLSKPSSLLKPNQKTNLKEKVMDNSLITRFKEDDFREKCMACKCHI